MVRDDVISWIEVRANAHEALVEAFWGIPNSLQGLHIYYIYIYSHQWLVEYDELVMDTADPHTHRYNIIWHTVP